jgi:RNA polymerase sigma factor (sigma-70 family)
MLMNIDEKQKTEFMDAYEAYAQAIYKHCFFRVYSQTRAEELVQETFMRVWQYLSQGKIVDNMRAFLYRVANNLIIDESRKKKEESLEILMEKSPAFEPSYEGHKTIQQDLLVKEVIGKMKDLPADYREILILRYVDDLDPKEIAQILDTNANNVSVKINRAVKALRTKL